MSVPDEIRAKILADLAVTPPHVAKITTIVESVIRQLPERERADAGGYCAVYASSSPVQLAQFKIGMMSEEPARECKRRSDEKALRLIQHPEHLTSFESRNPDQDQWGGAIRGNLGLGRIFSFSGLPEWADEVAMLLSAIELGDLYPRSAFKMAVISDNLRFSDLYSIYIGGDITRNDAW